MSKCFVIRQYNVKKISDLYTNNNLSILRFFHNHKLLKNIDFVTNIVFFLKTNTYLRKYDGNFIEINSTDENK